MFSRFITWQEPTIASKAEVDEQNTFQVSGECLDIRFGLKGYGFKKVGETSRVIHHFGNYKCYLRKVGDVDFRLFANAVCERAQSEGDSIYKDVYVQTGVLELGEYEIKVEAARLQELKQWSGGIVEGIDEDDQFWFDVAARQVSPNRIRAIERIKVNDISNQGLDPLPLGVIDPNPIFDEGIQLYDYLTAIALEHNIQQYEAFTVTDVLTIEAEVRPFVFDDIATSHYANAFLTVLNLIPSDFGDTIAVTDFRQMVIPGYGPLGIDYIGHVEYVFLDTGAIGIYQANDFVYISESVSLNKPGFREVWDNIGVAENFSANVAGTIRYTADDVAVDEFSFVHIEGTITVWDDVSTDDYLVYNVALTTLVFDAIPVNEFANAHRFLSPLIIDFIGVAEFAFVQFLRSIQVSDTITIAENRTILLPQINVFDVIPVHETVKIECLSPAVSDNITVPENVSVRLAWRLEASEDIGPITEQVFTRIVLSVFVQDTVPTTEFVQLTNLNAYAQDIINIVESASVSRWPLVSAIDVISVVEASTVINPLLYVPQAGAVLDVVSVIEFTNVSCPNTLKRDDILVVDFAQAFLPILTTIRSEIINVLDVRTVSIDQLYINVFDSITATEVITIGQLSVFDNVNVTDVLVIEIAPREETTAYDEAMVNGALFDVITIVEETAFTFETFISVSIFDTVGITEYASAVVGLGFATGDDAFVGGALYDIVLAVEFVNVNVFSLKAFSRFDSITVTENRTVQVGVGTVAAIDQASVNGALFDMISIQEFVNMGVV